MRPLLHAYREIQTAQRMCEPHRSFAFFALTPRKKGRSASADSCLQPFVQAVTVQTQVGETGFV